MDLQRRLERLDGSVILIEGVARRCDRAQRRRLRGSILQLAAHLQHFLSRRERALVVGGERLCPDDHRKGLALPIAIVQIAEVTAHGLSLLQNFVADRGPSVRERVGRNQHLLRDDPLFVCCGGALASFQGRPKQMAIR